MSRPWSPAEVAQRIPELDKELEDALTSLKELAADMAGSNLRYHRAKATAMLAVKESNKERREAAAALTQVAPGAQVVDLAYERDLAGSTFWNAKTAIDVRLGQLEMMRTLSVSAREIGK